MRAIFILFQKDLIHERNSGELILVSVTLCLLLGTLTAFGLREAVLAPEAIDRTFGTLVWLLFLFSGMLVSVRLLDSDLRDSAYQALLLSGASPTQLFLSKALFGGILLLALHALQFAILYIFLQPTFSPQILLFFLISVCVVCCFVSLSLLLSAIAEHSRLKAVLFPILLLPVLFPVFFGALSTTQDLFLNQQFDLTSFWVEALPALALVYLGLGVSLFEYVILE